MPVLSNAEGPDNPRERKFHLATAKTGEDCPPYAPRVRARARGCATFVTFRARGSGRLAAGAGEPLLQVGLDRCPAEMRVDVRITLLAKDFPDLIDTGGARRQLERTFDDVLGLHGYPDDFVSVTNGREPPSFRVRVPHTRAIQRRDKAVERAKREFTGFHPRTEAGYVTLVQ